MPEPNFLTLYSFSPEPAKKAPIIKLSCGIGDTDGFPAFDIDSEQYAAKDDSKWGFLITGGAEFHMPLTVFQVTPDGLADKGGICLGDIILEINEEDATQLTLAQAHEKINASGKKIHFLVKSMDDEEPMEGYESGEERSIVLRVPKPPPPPKVSVIERRLHELQRKLSEIAEIPKILSSTLATVSQTFDKLTTTLPQPAPASGMHCHHHYQNGIADCQHFLSAEQKRKLSYDEDVYDYELSDDENKTEDDTNNEEDFDAKEAYQQLKRYAARQRQSKDVTPESDYASESNFPQHESSSEEAEDTAKHVAGDNDIVNSPATQEENEDTEQMYEELNMCHLETPFGHFSNEHEECDEDETDGDADVKEVVDAQDSDDDDEDFLTTTFTWSLRNKPKLQVKDTDKHGDNDSLDNNDNIGLQSQSSERIDVDNALVEDKVIAEQQQSLSNSKNDVLSQTSCKADTPDKEQQKMERLERSWPWADREKIIYKQSTCHLVPHKPLGLIEQRIQLLAKRNLLEHINKIRNPQ